MVRRGNPTISRSRSDQIRSPAEVLPDVIAALTSSCTRTVPRAPALAKACTPSSAATISPMDACAGLPSRRAASRCSRSLLRVSSASSRPVSLACVSVAAFSETISSSACALTSSVAAPVLFACARASSAVFFTSLSMRASCAETSVSACSTALGSATFARTPPSTARGGVAKCFIVMFSKRVRSPASAKGGFAAPMQRQRLACRSGQRRACPPSKRRSSRDAPIS